jgi:transposase-like protein
MKEALERRSAGFFLLRGLGVSLHPRSSMPRYEMTRKSGSIRSQAVPIATGMDWDGPRHREWRPTARAPVPGRELLISLKQRGLKGMEMVADDVHPEIKKAIVEVLPESLSRCGTVPGKG